MASKKIPIGYNPAEAELEHRVEAMMEPVRIKVDEPAADSVEAAAAAPVVPETAPVESAKVTVNDHDDSARPAAIDIFSDPKTAPAVPSDLLEKLTAVVSATEPKTAGPVVQPIVPVTVAKPEPPPTPVIINRVPQLIASTAPKVAPPKPNSTGTDAKAYGTPDAAPDFTTADGPEESTDTLSVPPTQLDDAKTTAAIAAIAASESDELLAAQDALRAQSAGAPRKSAATDRPRRRLWLLPLLVIIILAILLAVPYSRYKLAGLVMTRTVTVKVLDSKTGRPVSRAVIEAGNQTVESDAHGEAQLKLAVGSHGLTIGKQYYSSTSLDTFAGFKPVGPLTISLVATGRQVPIRLSNALTGKPLAGADISISHTSAKTDGEGKAVVVLPAGQKTLTGTASAANYNPSSITVQITDTEVAANSFKLVPSGSVYVLSDASGTIDVLKTNLDGSKPITVVKGTGKEDANTTVLLASRDWKYLVLKAQRVSSQAALYLIDTSTDKLVEFDSGDANFTPIGWSGHAFLYDAVRNSVATSQNSHELLKSYDAERGQLNQLDATQASSAPTGFSYQGFYNFNLVDGLLVYNTQWYSSGGADISTKNATIRGVQSNGQNKKDYQSIPAAGLAYIQAAQATPDAVYYAVFNYSDNKNQYYAFQNQTVTAPTSVTAASFNKVYPSYLGSPSAKSTAWTETRDGKHVVVVGDATAGSSHVVPSLNGYSVYGWYGDDYLLVSKANSQLFIVPVGGVSLPSALVNYYRPAQNVATYSSGYGGL